MIAPFTRAQAVALVALLAVVGAAAAAFAVAAAQGPSGAVASVATAQPTPALPPPLPARERDILRFTLEAIDRGDWAAVRSYRETAQDPIVRKLIGWRIAASPESGARFDEIAARLAELSGWPAQDTMRRNAEQALLDSSVSPAERVRWFAAVGGPVSGDGEAALALALDATGETARAVEAARSAWRNRALTRRAEDLLIARFDAALTREDHAARVEGLLYRNDRQAAARLAPLLAPNARAIAEARVALQARQPRGLQALVDRASRADPDHPGLLYDRARYIRRSGRPEDALPVAARIDARAAPEAARETIAEEKRLYVNRALRNGDRRTAYRLVANHGLRSGVEFADSEWMAGWVALRFLNDPAQAAQHFQTLEAGVGAPVSKSRAFYWLGEAERARGAAAAADLAYQRAAAFDFTFYGQLAAQKRDPRHVLSLGDPPRPGPAERAAFENRELVRALRAMAAVGDEDDFGAIAFFLDDQLTTPLEHEMLSEIANAFGYPRVAVRNAKAGLIRGIVAQEGAYPVLDLPADARPPGRPEPALVHAIIRQESEFYPRAVSHAGARGLMQLMPATAQATARSYGLPYDRNRLLDDPQYNVSVGAAHLQQLLDEWNGSYVLAIASYNAGSGRPREWIEQWGDPRTGAIDVIDWIELIPFGETRNYVMRVMENLQVYRFRLSGTPVSLALTRDLERGARS